MNRSTLAKFAGAGVLTLGLAITPLSLPAVAQNTTESNQPAFDTTPLQETKDDFNNFGWLGLLGLIGLAKLFQKQKEPVRHSETAVSSSGYTDPNAVTSTSYTNSNDVSDTGYTSSPNPANPSGYTDPNVSNTPGYSDSDSVNRPGYTNPDVDVRDYRDNR